MIKTVAEARALAASAGLRVTFRSLGDWGTARLLAEYVPRDRTIAIDTAACLRLRERAGARFEERFVTCAIVHEFFHCQFPSATESDAHAFVRATTGEDPHAFARALRG